MTTPAELLEQRICLHLADRVRQLITDPSGAWDDLAPEMSALDRNSFRLVCNINQPENAKEGQAALTLVEEVVNSYTSELVRNLHGAYSYGEDYLSSVEDTAHLITFNPDAPLTMGQRYAALMVVQSLESDMQSASRFKKGRLHPAGTIIGGNYGVVQSPCFEAFAYSVNGALGKHALPEDRWGRVVFMTLAKNPDPAP